MKFTTLTYISLLALTLFSCDSEDSRTPLGITISAPDFSITIEENPEADISLGTLTAIASDESTIQFGNIILDDSEDSKFESETPIGALDIDNVTGELIIKDVSLFDFDLNTEINAVVNANSGNVSEAIAINIFLEEILNFDSDRDALIDIYESNIDNLDLDKVDWDITQTEISDVITWSGVTFTDNRITSIDLSNTGLTELPTSISKFSELTTLNLSDNQLTELPESIGELEQLTDLNSNTNLLTQLPDSIGELPQLTDLNLNTNLLIELPESIIDLENLVSLDISSNEITELSTAICNAFTFGDGLFIKDDTAICEDQ